MTDTQSANDDREPSGQRELLASLRVIDANANRVAEGLRVVEEYARFVLDDAGLTTICKRLRHDVAEAVGEIPYKQRVLARDTNADVGTSISTRSEATRTSSSSIAIASIERAQQGIRVIEEYAKLAYPNIAQRLEQLRYRCYSLGKSLVITADSLDRLRHVRLYVLVDGRQSESEFKELAGSLASAGVDAIQLRDKSLSDRELLGRARLLKSIVADHERPPLLIINDRPDLSLLAGADGVHVGQDELGVGDVRRIVGPEMLVGVSTHSIEQVRQAVADGANYLGCGPTFPSGTKSFEHFTGLEFLRQVAAEIALPAFAIGGITLSNLPDVVATGFRRVAVAGAVVNAPKPGAVAAQFGELLRGDVLR